MNINDELKSAYMDIIQEMDSSFFNADKELVEGLSGLFLPFAFENYAAAKNKIMLIGREPRGWNDDNRDLLLRAPEQYVEKAKCVHLPFFEGQLTSGKNVRGEAFHDFTRRVGEKSGIEGLIYSNLFCFSYNEGSPCKSPLYSKIRILSEKLLKAQIRILQPDIILFLNGYSGGAVKTRRQFFPIKGKKNVCINRQYYKDQGIADLQLWRFDLQFEGRLIKSYRTYHPSAISTKARASRDFLISLLPEA